MAAALSRGGRGFGRFGALALALWDFGLGKSIAGIDCDASDELRRLKLKILQLLGQREVVSIAHTAGSLQKIDKTVWERLALQHKQAESINGRVIGPVRCNDLRELQPRARVVGDVR